MTYEELKKAYDDLLKLSEGYWGQLAACRHAALDMTPGEERLTQDHPYYSDAYQAICELHDRVEEEAACGRKAAEIAQRMAASNARLRDALEVAKEAMDERRSYVNNGDPSTCWQEMKYGAAWDAEDEQVSKALEVKP